MSLNQEHCINAMVIEGDVPLFLYHTGLTVYGERFDRGVLVPAGWNAAGYPLNVLSGVAEYFHMDDFDEPSTFHLDLDGESIDYGLERQNFRVLSKENGSQEAVLTLCSSLHPVQIEIHTSMDGSPMLSRWIAITNVSDQEMSLSRLSVFNGIFEQIQDVRDIHPEAETENVYELGTFQLSMGQWEGQFHFEPLRFGATVISGRYNEYRYRHPAFFLKNRFTGQLFFGQLAWSGGYNFSFEYFADHDHPRAEVALDCTITGLRPLIVIKPGETYVSPTFHIGTIFGSLDQAVNAMYDHLRRSVFTRPVDLTDVPLIESGMGAEHDMLLDTSLSYVDQFSAMGAEAFLVDAGWYCPPHRENEWHARTGDWIPDSDRYPNGLHELSDYVHEKGMKFGLWMEPERIGRLSKAFQEHQDWFIRLPYQKTEPGFLDLSIPEAEQWAEEQAAKVIENYAVDVFRVDYNTDSHQYFFVKDGPRHESGSIRQIEGFYTLYRNLRKRFPNVVFENCAGGGGRTDLGMMESFDHTWVSDNQEAPRALLITSGMTMVLPPERVDRLFAGMGGHTRASLDFQMRSAMLTHMTLNVIAPARAPINTQQLAFVQHSVRLYKGFIRPFLPACRMYHIHADVQKARQEGFLAMEEVSDDQRKAVCGIFQLSSSCDELVTRVKLRGLNAGFSYQVTLDNSGNTFVCRGYRLMSDGIAVGPLGTLQSELVLLKECNSDA